MKEIELSGPTPSLSELVRKSQREDVIIVRKGKPLAVIAKFRRPKRGKWPRENDPKFIASIRKAREQYKRGEFKTLEEIRKKYNIK